jgi:EmrB/QacA subfamily drug resistance transporter
MMDKELGGRRRWWGLVIIALAQLMITVDTTIVTIALPSAQHDLGMSDADRALVVTAYTLVFGGLLLLGGRIADRVGHRRTLLTGVIGFAAVSAIGGLANSGWMLIGARAGQGLFAALLAPSTLALLVTIFTESAARSKAIGIYTAVLTAGGALGLVGGGLITSSLSWRWCMYVNIPVAIIAAVGAYLILPNLPARREVKVDVFGAIAGCGGIACLVYGFTEAGKEGWGYDRVALFLAAAAVLLIAFVLLQAKTRNPLLPLRIVADRNRGMAFATVGLATLGLFGVFLFLTYQLQIVMGYSAARTGVALLPLVVMNVVGATQVASRLRTKIAPRFIMVGGLLLAAGSLAILTQLTPGSSYAGVILPAELLLGLGIGTTFVPTVGVATMGVNPQDAGAASATVNTAQQVGASVGTALLNTIATSATAAYVTAHHTGLNQNAIVHGYSVAAYWALGIMLGTAALVAVLVNADPRTGDPAPQPADREPVSSPPGGGTAD